MSSAHLYFALQRWREVTCAGKLLTMCLLCLPKRGVRMTAALCLCQSWEKSPRLFLAALKQHLN